MKKAVFFDLTGRLPLDMDKFMAAFMKVVVESGFFEKISAEAGEDIFWRALLAMLDNDGRAEPRRVFRSDRGGIRRRPRRTDRPYGSVLPGRVLRLQHVTRADKHVKRTVEVLKDKGYRLILATNPLFPPVATNTRVRWAGLKPEDFEYITYYDNSHYCKPKAIFSGNSGVYRPCC